VVESRDLEFSALSCHGNPLNPNSEVATLHDEQFRNTVRLASELGVETVVTFSGCHGDSEHSKRPNWVTCPWPPDFLETLEWQWNERVIPYWQEAGAFAHEHGVKVAIEPHPRFVVYNTDSIWRLREAGGDNIGVNFDPSHLFWQHLPRPRQGYLGGPAEHLPKRGLGYQGIH
jgi:sugar phosphate isomerase/epimerase